MNNHLHIVSFDVPYPPNYGGIIDVFFKLKALSELGIKIHFHAFYYKGKNQPTPQLDKYCESVSYYKRSTGFLKFLTNKKPYIVSSREDDELLKNLSQDGYPILFEGLHTTAYLNHEAFKNRITLVRVHNIEHEYYAELGRNASGLKEKYYKTEASRLAKYEEVLKNASVVLSIAKQEVSHFERWTKTVFLPAFYNDKSSEGERGAGDYVLFHGNLSVEENENAVKTILEEIGNKIEAPIVIAGGKPGDDLKGLIENYPNVKLVPNPSDQELTKLIQEAKVNLVYAEKSAGVKLKLLHALNLGGHVVINEALNDGGLFSEVCSVTSKSDLAQTVNDQIKLSFTDEQKEVRVAFMNEHFNNLNNAEKLLGLI